MKIVKASQLKLGTSLLAAFDYVCKMLKLTIIGIRQKSGRS